MLNKLLKKHLKNEEGLTLIELLVVIVILGIIAAIAVVSIGNIIGNTKEKALVTEAVQIINAAKLKHSTDGKYPDKGWDFTSAADDTNGLNDYISNVKDKAWTVTWDASSKVYSITDHNAATVSEVKPEEGTKISEAVLTEYLAGK